MINLLNKSLKSITYKFNDTFFYPIPRYRKKRIVKSTRDSLVVFESTELTEQTHPRGSFLQVYLDPCNYFSSLKFLNTIIFCRSVFLMYRYIVAERSDKIRNDQQISNRKKPTLNKNISVKNIRAQIENMSYDENAGFKSEYNVRFKILS